MDNCLPLLIIITFLLGYILVNRLRNGNKKFSIKEIERFLRTKTTLENAISKLNEENILKANSGIRCPHCYIADYVEENECLLCEKKITPDAIKDYNYADLKHTG